MVITKPRYFMTLCAIGIALYLATPAAAGTLLVDFGASENTLIQSGWEGFERSSATQSASETFVVDFGMGAGGTVSVSVVGNTFRKRGNEMGAQADLLDDFCRSTSSAFGDTFVTLELTDLMAGVYEFTSYNYNSNTSYDREKVSIDVDDALGLRTVMVDVDQDNLAAAVNAFSLTVDATGSAILTFQSDNSTGDAVAVLNGFELASTDIPEPSTLVLLTLGVFLLCGRRCWRARYHTHKS